MFHRGCPILAHCVKTAASVVPHINQGERQTTDGLIWQILRTYLRSRVNLCAETIGVPSSCDSNRQWQFHRRFRLVRHPKHLVETLLAHNAGKRRGQISCIRWLSLGKRDQTKNYPL